MEGVTWKHLTNPEYVMTFLESFLLMFLPSLGFGNALDGGGVVELARWPSSQMFFGAIGLGILNGIRSLRNLRSPAPRINGQERRAAPPAPSGG